MSQSQPEVVHLVFKTHLDIGFTDFARNVVAGYFDDFIPRALAVTEELRRSGGDASFRWTTGAWLIYEYLEQATPTQRAQLERAIQAGDIVWHGLPFTMHSELMDADLFSFGLSLSQQLDQRFGRRTIAAKMTDVPGHTRAIVPLLAAAGIQFLHIGVNASSTPPDVPPVFVWRDPSGVEVLVMYQRGGYGDLVEVAGMCDVLAFAHTNDNHGPQTAAQVRAEFAALRQRFPTARIVASTLDAFAERLLEFKNQLPIVTGELGDTWIHGVGSDPKKVSDFRELSRLRRHWLESGRIRPDDPQIQAFSRALLMVAEHTWGMDEKIYLDDYQNYARAQFDSLRTSPRYQTFAASWAEQRTYLDAALAALDGTALADEARTALRLLEPARPNAAAMQHIAPSERIDGTQVSLGIDAQTGAIAQLTERATGRVWADPQHMLALLRYQTFAQADYDRFRRQYSINKRTTAFWAVPDFTKPGMAASGAESRWWLPNLSGLHHSRTAVGEQILIELALPTEATERYGCPAMATLEITLPDAEPALYFDLQWFEKPASRLPEALWLSFMPRAAVAKGWTLEKMGQRIAPLEVVRDGNRRLHAVEAAEYHDADDYLRLDTLDAPLIAPGEPALLNFSNRQPPLQHGMHVNLYNNVWGTNFPMWYAEDARFRFVLRFSPSVSNQPRR
ncbi:MAG: DUF5054 domain-containing protein [Roseiflexaceae bacterium]